jgi:hypothetical protein
MSDTPEARPAAANSTDSIPPSTLHIENAAGHESPFVQPKTYLRPESRAMEIKSLTSLDKEQMQGLVSELMGTAM